MRNRTAPLKDVHGLTAGGGLAPGPSPIRRARLALALLALLCLLAAAVPLARAATQTPPPAALTELHLAGPRPPGCVNLAILVDESGSMTDFATQRTASLTQLFNWAARPGNLRDNDTLTVIDWAGQAAVSLPPTAVPAARTAPLAAADPAALGGGTLLLPALQLFAAQPPTGCRTAVLAISDGLIADTGDEPGVRSILEHAGATSVALLNPTGDQMPSTWQTLMPYSRLAAADQSDPDQLALALGAEVAAATGQQLDRTTP